MASSEIDLGSIRSDTPKKVMFAAFEQSLTDVLDLQEQRDMAVANYNAATREIKGYRQTVDTLNKDLADLSERFRRMEEKYLLAKSYSESSGDAISVIRQLMQTPSDQSLD